MSTYENDICTIIIIHQSEQKKISIIQKLICRNRKNNSLSTRYYIIKIFRLVNGI